VTNSGGRDWETASCGTNEIWIGGCEDKRVPCRGREGMAAAEVAHASERYTLPKKAVMRWVDVTGMGSGNCP
jgi:hypothetical protein